MTLEDIATLGRDASALKDYAQTYTADEPVLRLAGMVCAAVLLAVHAPGTMALRATVLEAREYGRGLDMTPWETQRKRHIARLARDIIARLEVML